MGEKARLATRLIPNGTITHADQCPLITFQSTKLKEMRMMTYSTVHTGPKIHAGGAKNGFFCAAYQRAVSAGFIRNGGNGMRP